MLASEFSFVYILKLLSNFFICFVSSSSFYYIKGFFKGFFIIVLTDLAGSFVIC